MADVCPECGAAGCREKFETMLALEFEDPRVFGAVHHVTVICYNLQHPGAFTDEALDWMRSTLRAIIEEGLSASEIRERSRKKFNGHLTVLRKAATKPRDVGWSMTVMAVRTDSPDVYVKDVTAWAKSILKDMKK
jgi:2'-5' RNA ligase